MLITGNVMICATYFQKEVPLYSYVFTNNSKSMSGMRSCFCCEFIMSYQEIRNVTRIMRLALYFVMLVVN